MAKKKTTKKATTKKVAKKEVATEKVVEAPKSKVSAQEALILDKKFGGNVELAAKQFQHAKARAEAKGISYEDELRFKYGL
jgi:hypothetical protein